MPTETTVSIGGKRAGRRLGTALAASLSVMGAVAAIALLPSAPAYAADSATINGATTFQTMSGFGASEAFGQSDSLMNAPAAEQKQALDFLYSPTAGAGLTILRNEISADSGSTIEPTAPSSPTAAPSYVSLASISQDDGQLWLAQQIKADYGVTDVFADAWSAPAFMKTNDSVDNGGALCGVPSATCSSGDWRQAYANYLVQYAADYAAAGVPLTYVGPENEANLSTSYDSMQLSPSQTANLLDVLGPAVAGSGLSTKVECCATEGWDQAQLYAAAIEGDSVANSYTPVFTSHNYTEQATSALSGWSKPTWETEWFGTSNAFDAAWDDGTADSGFTWAQRIYQGLTEANQSAYLYWEGADTNNANGGLVWLNSDGTASASSRLWAFANYSRYIHPGAVRISATSSNSGLDISAYKNTDGTVAVVVLNTASSSDTLGYTLSGTGITSGTATPVLTNASSNAAAQAGIAVSGGAFSATVPARSLVTYVIAPGSGPTGSASASASPSHSASPSASASASSSPSSSPSASPSSSPTGGAGCTVQYSTTSQWTGGFTANVVIDNNGTSAINGWTLKFTFAGDQTIADAWNAATTQSGEAVTATNESYNAAIAPGGSTSFGFQGTWNASDSPPTAFTLNGASCTA